MNQGFIDFEQDRSDRRRRAFLQKGVLFFGFLVCLFAAFRFGEVSVTALMSGMGEAGAYFVRLLPSLSAAHATSDLAGWYWGFGAWSAAVIDTVIIAFVSTTIGTIFAVPLGFIASRNLTHRAAYVIVRRTLEAIRTVPALVYALAFVLSFGLGPTAGVLAIALHTASSLGKLFSEVNEAIEEKQVEGVRASGGDWFSIVRFGVFPQVLPAFISYVLLRLEKNIRSATVIGFVGAGGIGQELYIAIRSFQYQDVSAIALLIIALVALSDIACEHLRRRVI